MAHAQQTGTAGHFQTVIVTKAKDSKRFRRLRPLLLSLNAQETSNAFVVTLSTDALFHYDQATFKPTATHTIQTVAKLIQHLSARRVNIGGHSDSVGDSVHNQQLSLQRAQSFKEQLIQTNLVPDGTRFYVSGHGRWSPKVPDQLNGKYNSLYRMQNRRIEIKIYK